MRISIALAGLLAYAVVALPVSQILPTRLVDALVDKVTPVQNDRFNNWINDAVNAFDGPSQQKSSQRLSKSMPPTIGRYIPHAPVNIPTLKSATAIDGNRQAMLDRLALIETFLEEKRLGREASLPPSPKYTQLENVDVIPGLLDTDFEKDSDIDFRSTNANPSEPDDLPVSPSNKLAAFTDADNSDFE